MAQWIADEPTNVIVSSSTRDMYNAQGQLIATGRRTVQARFRRGIAPPYAVEIARDTLTSFHRMPERGMTVQQWVPWYDSADDQATFGWTDEEREAIEAHLRSGRVNGIYEVHAPTPDAPYALYDKHRKIAGRRTLDHVLHDIRNAHETAGFDVAQAIAYERVTLNDPAVVEALEQLDASVVESEEDLVEA